MKFQCDPRYASELSTQSKEDFHTTDPNDSRESTSSRVLTRLVRVFRVLSTINGCSGCAAWKLDPERPYISYQVGPRSSRDSLQTYPLSLLTSEPAMPSQRDPRI
jgi:hypothetical protein